jgi:hypothetical protein
MLGMRVAFADIHTPMSAMLVLVNAWCAMRLDIVRLESGCDSGLCCLHGVGGSGGGGCVWWLWWVFFEFWLAENCANLCVSFLSTSGGRSPLGEEKPLAFVRVPKNASSAK